MRLFIVRHGETNWNREGRFQGRTDTELSELGLSQAKMLAEYLRGNAFEAIVTSPLSRARVTAECVRDTCSCGTFEVEDALTEICHGDWEGLPADEVNRRWPDVVAAWHSRPDTVVMPGAGGESLCDVQGRVMRCVWRMAERFSGDVLLAAHDAVIKVLLLNLLSAPLSAFWSLKIANCSLSMAEVVTLRRPTVSLISDFHYLNMGFASPEQKGL